MNKFLLFCCQSQRILCNVLQFGIGGRMSLHHGCSVTRIRQICGITVTSNERHGVSNHGQRNCPHEQFVLAKNNENQSSNLLAFVGGVHRWHLNSPHKGPEIWTVFPCHDIIRVKLRNPEEYDERGIAHRLLLISETKNYIKIAALACKHPVTCISFRKPCKMHVLERFGALCIIITVTSHQRQVSNHR